MRLTPPAQVDNEGDDCMIVNGKKIKYTGEKVPPPIRCRLACTWPRHCYDSASRRPLPIDPPCYAQDFLKVDWAAEKVDMILECSGSPAPCLASNASVLRGCLCG